LQEHKDAGCEQGPFANLKTQHKVKNTEIMWDFKFSRRRVWSSESSGMYCRVLNWMSTDVSEVHAASIIALSGHTNRVKIRCVSMYIKCLCHFVLNRVCYWTMNLPCMRPEMCVFVLVHFFNFWTSWSFFTKYGLNVMS
jgi:hypothetical protein